MNKINWYGQLQKAVHEKQKPKTPTPSSESIERGTFPYMQQRVMGEVKKGLSENVEKKTYPHLKERTQEHLEKTAEKDWNKYHRKEVVKGYAELARLRGTRKLKEIAHTAGKHISKSLMSKAVYRRGPKIGSSYNIRSQLNPPATYADEPARYYKKVYSQEKRSFFFK